MTEREKYEPGESAIEEKKKSKKQAEESGL